VGRHNSDYRVLWSVPRRICGAALVTGGGEGCQDMNVKFGLTPHTEHLPRTQSA
jgi:hypothetical protein